MEADISTPNERLVISVKGIFNSKLRVPSGAIPKKKAELLS